ncbi:MAG: hypothetical protein M3483_06345 [Gemmatimonadota bacterium]|nr:hypothetical protein [Gemmatimonadota bacterium]
MEEGAATLDSPLRAETEAMGAVVTEVAGRSVAERFGEIADEYRILRTEAGVADRADRAVIRVTGKDPVRMIQGLITNDLQNGPIDRAVYAAMLTPKGRTIAELRALRLDRPAGTELLLELPREALAGACAQLRKFVPPMFARWADVSEEIGEIGVYGPRSRERLAAVVGELPEMEEDDFVELEWEGSTLQLLSTRQAGGEEGFELLAPAPLLPALWRALVAGGARPVGRGALEILRVEAGRPRSGAELSEEVIPTEAYEAIGMMPRAISFTKGCYTGQEVIVRIAHRGHVNRHLRGLLLGSIPIPERGTPLLNPASGKEVGRITTPVESPGVGQTIALGFVRREIVSGDELRLGSLEGTVARVVELPFQIAR